MRQWLLSGFILTSLVAALALSFVVGRETKHPRDVVHTVTTTTTQTSTVTQSRTSAAATSAPPPSKTAAAIFAEPACSASEQEHVAEVVLYGATCSSWIADASGNAGLTGLFSGLWQAGLTTPLSEETLICALLSGTQGIDVYDSRGGDIGTNICEGLVHAGWTEVH